jgi:hypothetical protein
MSTKIFAGCLAIGGMALLGAPPARAVKSNGGVEARVIVTVADHMNHKPIVLTKEDLGESASLRVTRVVPAFGDKEIYILIDNAANYDFGTKVEELRSFVNSQSPSTAIGLAFITDGELRIALTPAKDHELVARALRAPSGSKPANPYCALSSLINGWPEGVERREVLMITSGIDYTIPAGVVCSNAEAAIADAQRAGVSVYAIYHPVAQYGKEEWQRVDNGVVELSHVCYETGGEAYFVSHSAMETITPFLDDIYEHLANQYLVTVVFDGRPESGFRDLAFNAAPTLELMAPAKVWVGGAGH